MLFRRFSIIDLTGFLILTGHLGFLWRFPLTTRSQTSVPRSPLPAPRSPLAVPRFSNIHFWIAFLQEAINQPKHSWFCGLKTFLRDQNSKAITDKNKYWTMLEMPDLIGCWKVLNLMAGIFKSRGVIYRIIIIISIMQKPETIIFVVGVVSLTLTFYQNAQSRKKTNKQKTLNLLQIFQRLSPIVHSKRYTQTNLKHWKT